MRKIKKREKQKLKLVHRQETQLQEGKYFLYELVILQIYYFIVPGKDSVPQKRRHVNKEQEFIEDTLPKKSLLSVHVIIINVM